MEFFIKHKLRRLRGKATKIYGGFRDMKEKEDYLDTQNFLGDNRIFPYEVYQRGTYMKCIYCGDFADSREHCPSRTFLKEPRPCNLPVLPACKRCNNSFSADELYVKTYIEYMKSAWLENKIDLKNDLKTNSIVIKAKDRVNEVLKTGQLRFDKRIGRILEKLAKGHCVYELTENYYGHEWVLKEISYTFRCFVEEKEWMSIELFEYIEGCPLPEIGSRTFRNMYVLDMDMEELESKKLNKNKHLVLMWNVVQEGNYEYVAFINHYGEIVVKIIIKDFLYAEISFEERVK